MSIRSEKVPKHLRKTPISDGRFCCLVSGGYPFFVPLLAVFHPKKVAIYLLFSIAVILRIG